MSTLPLPGRFEQLLRMDEEQNIIRPQYASQTQQSLNVFDLTWSTHYSDLPNQSRGQVREKLQEDLLSHCGVRNRLLALSTELHGAGFFRSKLNARLC